MLAPSAPRKTSTLAIELNQMYRLIATCAISSFELFAYVSLTVCGAPFTISDTQFGACDSYMLLLLLLFVRTKRTCGLSSHIHCEDIQIQEKQNNVRAAETVNRNSIQHFSTYAPLNGVVWRMTARLQHTTRSTTKCFYCNLILINDRFTLCARTAHMISRTVRHIHTRTLHQQHICACLDMTQSSSIGSQNDARVKNAFGVSK